MVSPNFVPLERDRGQESYELRMTLDAAELLIEAVYNLHDRIQEIQRALAGPPNRRE